MSDQQSATGALTRRWQPTSEDVELLNLIVNRAQQNPLATPKDSLSAAYQDVFQEHGRDPQEDRVCLWLLSKLVSPDAEGDNLFEKLENILSKEGIVLTFDDDSVANGTVPSPAKYVPHNDRRTGPTRSASASMGSRRASTDRRVESVYSAVVDDSLDDLNAYIDNPPPHIAQLMRVAERMDKKKLFESCEMLWPTRNIVAMERAADNHYEYRLRYKVATHWRNVTGQLRSNLRLADDVYLRSRAEWASTKLLDAARINRLQAMEEERLRSLSLYKMAVASREASFCRTLDIKLMRKGLWTMVNTFRATSAHQRQLEVILQTTREQTSLRRLHPAIGKLVSCTQRVQAMSTTADQIRSSSLSAKAMSVLMRQTRGLAEMNAVADNARRIFLMRKYLLKMKNAAQGQRLRRILLSRWAVKLWRARVDEKKRREEERRHAEYDAAYKVIRRKVKTNLARRCLSRLVARSSDIRDLDQVATRHVESKFRAYAHSIVVRWYSESEDWRRSHETAITHADQLALKHTMATITSRKRRLDQLGQVSDQFHDLHVQGAAATCLKSLSRKVFEIRRRQEDASAFRSRLDKQMIRSYVDEWRRKLAEKRGEGPLILPPATPAQRRADQLSRLASTTPLVPPRTPFTARLRGEGRRPTDIIEEGEGGDDDEDK